MQNISTQNEDLHIKGGELVIKCDICAQVRKLIAEKVRKCVPSPSSELLLGTTLGLNDLKFVPRFNDLLYSTGTIHILVVSGFNLSLLINKVLSLMKNNKSFYTLLLAEIGAAIYALITGLEPPILRALLMVSISIWAGYRGRNISQVRILLLSSVIILILWPAYIYNLSFQLSFLATYGLVSYDRVFYGLFKPLFGPNIIVKDTSSSIAAQLYVSPALVIYFNTLNLTSFIINGLILWAIPYLTILSFLVIFVALISSTLGQFFGIIFHAIVSIFIYALSNLNKVSITYLVNNVHIFYHYVYYIALYLIICKPRRHRSGKDPIRVL